jgi:hypothetical protein
VISDNGTVASGPYSGQTILRYQLSAFPRWLRLLLKDSRGNVDWRDVMEKDLVGRKEPK